jgi:effector-binding domain-containing protein
VEIRTVHLEATPTAVVRTTIPVETIPAFLGHAYHSTAAHIERWGADFAGPPFARYTPVADDARAFEIEAGFPVTNELPGDGEVEASELPAGEAIAVTHRGPYDAMRPVYEALSAWLHSHEAVPDGSAWEVYYGDPDVEPDETMWRTDVIQPFRTRVVSR